MCNGLSYHKFQPTLTFHKVRKSGDEKFRVFDKNQISLSLTFCWTRSKPRFIKMANLVNVKFNQLLSRVQGRVQGESKGISIGKANSAQEEAKPPSSNPSLLESKGLSISKVITPAASETTTNNTSKNTEVVDFSSL